jgi:hypothetical protein
MKETSHTNIATYQNGAHIFIATQAYINTYKPTYNMYLCMSI